MIKVLICDDSEEIRMYFEWIIDSQNDMKVVATAKNGKDVVEKAVEVNPDVILMDIQMEKEKSGIEATEIISRKLQNVKIIMLTIHNNDDLLLESYVAGASDYIIKEDCMNTLCKTIRNAYNNQYYIGSIIAQKVKDVFNRAVDMEKSAMYFINCMSNMTNSEWKILKHLYKGKKRKEIAAEEILSEETVKYHIRNILKKLGFSNTAEMIGHLKKMGIIEKFNL